TTAGLGPLIRFDRGDDKELAYGFSRAHNRYMVDFCSVDRRLLPVCHVPIGDLERVGDFTAETIELGAAALMVSSMCPKTHSPSHVALDRVWAQAEEAGIPVVTWDSDSPESKRQAFYGIDDEANFWVRNYHRLLVWDIMRGPFVTRFAERILNPVMGKSLVLYADKPR
ncbi:MAG: hypothetical protein KY395_08080, partial [Actinobacteria bacterium]|nr:hypothetical protein [Actinomycetota bacterium]